MVSEKVMKAKVSAKGWVVIPAVLRKRFGLKPGTVVELQEAGEKIVLTPATKNLVDELYGKFAGKISLTDELLEDRRKELKREEAGKFKTLKDLKSLLEQLPHLDDELDAFASDLGELSVSQPPLPEGGIWE